MVRPRGRPRTQFLRHVRARAALLLFAAVVHGAPHRSAAQLCFRQISSLAVSNADRLGRHTTKFGLQPRRGLYQLARRRAVAISTLQVVRGREAATTRLVVILFVIRKLLQLAEEAR